ncbi:uncharacterized protein LOC103574057 [Microplitis demolitor]|uniref:uncharacterized protein LOC103574057 n=1 Tax=Microplitis demolitor TaxID=69319 RepID=UPI0004CCDF67|nr:uncharacterized protein LOC103574057 [Microplitis demolitor]
MAPIESPSNEVWSQCSINDFHNNLRDRDFSCMYNQPAFDNGAGNGNNNPPTINTPIPHDPNNNNNQAPTVFHVEITDDRDQLTVGLKDFSQNRKIEIYYQHNKLVITQRDTDYSSTSTGYKQDLQIRVADNRMITLDPSEINPSKLIYIYHDNGYIYVYQGSKPGSDRNYVPQPPDNDNSGGSDHWPWGHQYAFCFGRSHFQLNKLVSINFRNNKLYVSQRNVPNNQYVNSPPPPSDLEYTGSDTKAIYIVPSSIKPNTELCAWQANGLIYVRTRNMNSAH